MKFYFNFQEAALHLAVSRGNTEIVKLLLSNSTIDINSKRILNDIYILLKIKLQMTFQNNIDQ